MLPTPFMRSLRRSRPLFVSLAPFAFASALLGCTKDKPATIEAVDAGIAPVATTAPSGTVSASTTRAKKKRVPLKPQERVAAASALAQGRKKALAKDWTGALAAFETGLAVTKHDVHLLGEAGWAAFNAGDLGRAEDYNRRALRVVRNPEIRAQILYNTGRVYEAKHQAETARQVYAESISLRDNAEVNRRLNALGGAPTDVEGCEAGAGSIDALCQCLLASDVLGTELGSTNCAPQSAPPTGSERLTLLRWGWPSLQNATLVAHAGRRLVPVADVGEDFDPEVFGIHRSIEFKGGEVRHLGKREVVVVRAEQFGYASSAGGLEVCVSNKVLDVVCAVTDRPRCVTVPVEVEDSCDAGAAPTNEDDRRIVTELSAGWERLKLKLSWTLEEDGTVVVQHVDGQEGLVPSGTIGSHPLF